MSVILPLDVLNRCERRWTARVSQAESFHAKTERLKQNADVIPEGARPPANAAPSPNDGIPKGRSTSDQASS